VNLKQAGTMPNLRFRGYTSTEIFVIVLCCLSCGHAPVMTKRDKCQTPGRLSGLRVLTTTRALQISLQLRNEYFES
jgi:hypothetical protein